MLMVFPHIFSMYQIHARVKVASKKHVRIMGETRVCAMKILCGMQTELIVLVRNQRYLTSEKKLVDKVELVERQKMRTELIEL